MAYKMQWDKTGERIYETGVSQMVFYKQTTAMVEGTPTVVYDKGVAWNGISNVSEDPSGGDENKIYADNQKYLSLFAAEDFGATIEAYYSPEEFDECDGTLAIIPGVYAGQQTRKGFGFSYRTELGNDVDGTDYGYKLHIVYNAKAQPSSRAYATTNESPDAMSNSWTVTTTPEKPSVPVYAADDTEHKNPIYMKATAQIKLDSTRVDSDIMKKVECLLYGTDGNDELKDGTKIPACEPQLPTLDNLLKILQGGEYTAQTFIAG